MQKLLLLFLSLAIPAACLAQSGNTKTDNAANTGFGIDVSTLGLGLQGAVKVTPSLNFRAGLNALDYSHTLTNDGINYDGHLHLRSAQVNLDWFFLGDFHLSPGMLVYNGNKGTASASVAGGQQFSLGGTNYSSSAVLPVTGNGTLSLNKTAPMLLLGWGNMIPRHGSRFSVNFEAGAAYQGSPQVTMNLAGSICDPSGNNCQNAATAPLVQTNIQAEEQKLDTKLHPFKLYPVVSLGFSFSFGS